MYLDVLVFRQARRNAGQSVVVQVQLSQVGNVGQRAVLHGADLIVAQTQPEENQRAWVVSNNKGFNGRLCGKMIILIT